MKKAFPYIIGVLVLIAALALSLTMKKGERKLNERLSFSRKDKIPYGTYVAYENLKYLFPDASVKVNRLSPEKWYADSVLFPRQALIIITPQFLPDEDEMDKLIAFAQKGNSVFISTRVLSYNAQEMLHCRTPYNEFVFFANAVGMDDTLNVLLNNPPFTKKTDFLYPGKRFESHLYKYDTAITNILGTNKDEFKNFIHLKTGKGNIFLHMAPVAFTNYFLLHKDNAGYYDEALSVIPKDVTDVTWDEYYLHKLYEGNYNKGNRGWLYVLLKYPPFKWGLLVAIIAIGLFVLLETRRKQRYIPFVSKPKNDSLDFVKTIGRLYYEKNDHRDLAKKMGLYFLEHIRNTYKLPTGQLDEEFVKNLHYKSGYNQSDLKKIVSFIDFVNEAPGVTDAQLAEFHKDLEDFYKH